MLRASSFRLHFAALVAFAALASAAPAQAQSNGCQDGQNILVERQTLVQQLNKTTTKDKKIDPRGACPVLRKMVTNGESGLKWIEANKDWCQIPDQLAQGFAQDHEKVKTLRTQACEAAAKIAEMEKQARAQQQGGGGGGGGLLGGNTLSGEYKIPRGAL